jgi:beta-1,2-mannobiose phosphorylase / 1,2-beta-oligomannan phosphorylase
MATSNESDTHSIQEAALTVGVGQPEGPVSPRSVEQLLTLQRLGAMMTPDPARPEEAMGVLNPASARSPEGDLYLFPRIVATGNYSRIAIAAVRFDDAGNPAGVERLGLALEPRESYEIVEPGIGGVEDPRITYIPLLGCYVMTYTALGPSGARIALAVSQDLHTWDRLGPLQFEVRGDVDLNRCDNKDCVIFPLPLLAPDGRSSLALLHRPIYLVPRADGSTEWLLPTGVTDRRPSIWISYVPVDRVKKDIRELTTVGQHQLLAQPIGRWEHHHIGAGAPPILSEEGWLLYYHGVIGGASAGLHAPPGGLVYQSGVMLLDRDDPRRVLYRSSQPVLLPEERGEQEGIVSNVVFPTAVDVRGQRVDIYYGAADERIAAATTRITASVLMAPSAPPGVDASVPRISSGVHAGEMSRLAGQARKGETGMQVKDSMTTSVEVVTPDTALAEAANRMQSVDVGVLPVQDDGVIVGVVTDRDMTVRAIAQGLDTRTATVADVMTRRVHTCFEDETLEEAADTMARYQVRRLVVLDRGHRLVGVISLDDVAAGASNPGLAGKILERTAFRPARGRYDRILVALDGSQLAERVLPTVEPLAQKFGSRLILLRALPPAEAPVQAAVAAGAMSSGGQTTAQAGVGEAVRQEAASYLATVQQRLEATGLNVQIECSEGLASDLILRRATELDADLIALTTHGRTGLDRLLLGSVAEDVIRRTPCPVHLVRVLSSG